MACSYCLQLLSSHSLKTTPNRLSFLPLTKDSWLDSKPSLSHDVPWPLSCLRRGWWSPPPWKGNPCTEGSSQDAALPWLSRPDSPFTLHIQSVDSTRAASFHPSVHTLIQIAIIACLDYRCHFLTDLISILVLLQSSQQPKWLATSLKGYDKAHRALVTARKPCVCDTLSCIDLPEGVPL